MFRAGGSGAADWFVGYAKPPGTLINTRRQASKNANLSLANFIINFLLPSQTCANWACC
jgi:hypothetical protein